MHCRLERRIFSLHVPINAYIDIWSILTYIFQTSNTERERERFLYVGTCTSGTKTRDRERVLFPFIIRKYKNYLHVKQITNYKNLLKFPEKISIILSVWKLFKMHALLIFLSNSLSWTYISIFFPICMIFTPWQQWLGSLNL